MAGTLLFSCETDPEKLEIVKPYPKSDQYYADLRDYKNSDHEIVFGWFGNWSATGASASTTGGADANSENMTHASRMTAPSRHTAP